MNETVQLLQDVVRNARTGLDAVEHLMQKTQGSGMRDELARERDEYITSARDGEQALSDAGIELEAGTDMQNERMNYDFYRCACSASETATFCYCKGSAGRGGEKHPSHPVSVIGEAFPDAESLPI